MGTNQPTSTLQALPLTQDTTGATAMGLIELLVLILLVVLLVALISRVL